MSQAEFEELKDHLLNYQKLNGEYLLSWGRIYKEKETEDKKQGNPITNKSADELLAYLKTLPLEFDAHAEAILRLMVRNNERMLRLFELLNHTPS